MADGILWYFPWRATCLVLLCTVAVTLGGRCDREPEEARSTPRTPADGRFRISISGNPEKYVPGVPYTVTLQGTRSPQTTNKFSGFMLVVESTSGVNSLPYGGPEGGPWATGKEVTEPHFVGSHKAPPVGTIQLFGDALSKFSERCPNMVTQTSSIPKSEVQVRWAAPAAGSGCVVFRATVVESRDVWYMDEGPLTKKLCEEVQESHDEQPPVVDNCCACDEAKYEVTFEGLWSRHTHPKDFPTNGWLTRFSDVIGASHTVNYRFWEYGGMASEGLRNVAEKGLTRKLESELKAKSEDIRTIIKARGISYPNVTGKTFAVFRVDRKHHLMSLVSMLDPSPDWIVGVSGLELCQSNCSWIESKVLNLYPWDAGTDDGITYISPDSPTQPQEIIRRVTSSFPNDKRSPFYDPSGVNMKPLARLNLSRQRLYEKVCDATLGPTGEDPEDERPECEVGAWTKWSACSVTCGRGVKNRQRYYLSDRKAQMANCNRKISESTHCLGKIDHCDPPRVGQIPTEMPSNSWCAVSEWGSWSSCSASCGRRGVRVRSRRLMSHHGHKKCRNPPSLLHTQPCPQPLPPCQEDYDSEIDEIPNCRVGKWTEWSPCSVTCGHGQRSRTRAVHNVGLSPRESDRDDLHGDDEENEDEDDEIDDDEDECSRIRKKEFVECKSEEETCEMNEDQAKVACAQKPLHGPCGGLIQRWYFDEKDAKCKTFIYGGCRSNRNNFLTEEECERVCQGYKEEVRANLTARLQHYGVSVSGTLLYAAPRSAGYSKDSSFHHHRPSCAPLTNGPIFGGLTPDSQLGQTSRRRDPGLLPSPTVAAPPPAPFFPLTTNDSPIVDCVVSRWSKWTPCNATCGPAWKRKWRNIVVHPKNGGRPCPKRLFKKKTCRLPRCDPTSDSQSYDLIPEWGEPKYKVMVDCQLGEWSPWSPCSQSCGPSAVQQRTRALLVAPGALGKPCGSRLEHRPCSLLPCLLLPRQ